MYFATSCTEGIRPAYLPSFRKKPQFPTLGASSRSGASSLKANMSRLSAEKRAQVIGCPTEGMSIRATFRITGIAKNTITKLLVDLGEIRAEYQDGSGLRSRRRWISGMTSITPYSDRYAQAGLPANSCLEVRQPANPLSTHPADAHRSGAIGKAGGLERIAPPAEGNEERGGEHVAGAEVVAKVFHRGYLHMDLAAAMRLDDGGGLLTGGDGDKSPGPTGPLDQRCAAGALVLADDHGIALLGHHHR